MTDAATATDVVIAGGGTAGHVLPGLAIARALVARGHEVDAIHFVGSERGLEVRLVPEAGFPLHVLAGRGIERRVSVSAVRSALSIVKGVVQGIGLLRRLHPKVVVVLGGYAAVPCVVASVLWRIPMVVAEQNAKAGAANRLAGRFAKACAVPFPGTDLPRAVVTGNPVRDEILGIDRATDGDAARRQLGLPADRVVIAVFSGSLGSRRINTAVRALADRWIDRTDVAIHHVAGTRDWDALQAEPFAARPVGLVYDQIRYQDRMDLLLAAADLAVCRSGGTTVAELAAVGLGSVLVPLPIAPRDHQTANAGPLVAAGAALLVDDADLDADKLDALLSPLLDVPATLVAMGTAARTLAIPDAADRVAALADEVARP